MKTTFKQLNKATLITDYLEEQIYCGMLKPGQNIPTLRKLQELFNMPLSTVKRSVDMLCAKGLLETVQGAGTFVTGRHIDGQDDRECIIMTLFPFNNSSTGVLGTVYNGIVNASRKRNVQLLFSHVKCEDMNEKRLKKIIDECSALILLGEYGGLRDLGLNFKMPISTCGMANDFGGRISVFEMDPYQSAEIAVEYFHRNNIKHVKCYNMSLSVMRMRFMQFEYLWKKSGGTIDYHEFETYSEIDDFEFEPSGAFLFMTGWMMNIFCRRSKSDFGVSLPENATILGLDGRCYLDPEYELAPSISTSWKAIGHDIFSDCMLRIKKPGASPRRCYYPVKLIEP